MAGTIHITPCPQCKTVGGLHMSIQLVAKPLGTYSLAGVQTKVSAREAPVLECRNCDLHVVGEFDGGHASFDPRKVTNAATRDTTNAPETT